MPENLGLRTRSITTYIKIETGLDVGFRTLNTFSISVSTNKSASKSSKSTWIDGNVTSKEKIGNTETTAQVNPYLLTKALFQAAVQKGATLVIDKVIDVESEKTENSEYVVKVCMYILNYFLIFQSTIWHLFGENTPLSLAFWVFWGH